MEKNQRFNLLLLQPSLIKINEESWKTKPKSQQNDNLSGVRSNPTSIEKIQVASYREIGQFRPAAPEDPIEKKKTGDLHKNLRML